MPEAREVARAKPGNAGHRDRLRQRLLAGGTEAIADYELLEFLLFAANARKDMKPVAKALLARFGNLACVLGASREALLAVADVGPSAAAQILGIREAGARLARGAVAKRAVISSWQQLLDYCNTRGGFAETEQTRLLFLDRKNALIADEQQQTGTVDHVPLYPREVVKRALELGASAIILIHNYPSRHSSPCSITYRHSWSVIQHDFHRRSPVGDRPHQLEPGEKKTGMSRWSFAASS
jgi:DNA repair protein RadC